jgi:steroid delta-isomerase-like uncharacterized protein
MGASENLAVHTRWTDAEERQDLSHHREFLHEEIELRMPGADPIVGVDAYCAHLEATYRGLPDFHVIADDRFATDDRVVCRWRTSGTHSGELFGMPATGKTVEFPGMCLWEFDDGKARRGWVFPDVVSLMSQLQK